MNAKTLRNLKLFLMLLLCALSMAIVCFTDYAKADDFSISDLSLEMNSDATFFSDEKNGKFGMLFTATLPESEYELLSSQVKSGAYSDVEYGVLILPKYYTETYPLNYDTLFGPDAVYDFAEYVDFDWKYSGDKIRIININANDWTDNGDVYLYSGGIVDIKDGSKTFDGVNNLSLEMYSAAYIKVVFPDDSVECKFSAGVSSSAAYMAQKEIESGKYDDITNAFLKENFIDKVIDRFTYTTEYYVKVDGGYELFDSVVSDEAYAIGTVVYASTDDFTATGFVFDKTNPLNVLSSSVYADDRTTLKVYFKLDAEHGLLNVANVKSVDFEFIAKNNPSITKFKLFKTVGNKDYAISYTTGSVVDVSNFDGTYRFSAGHNETVESGGSQSTVFVEDVSISFDCYNPSEEYVYTSTELLNKSYAGVIARHVATRGFVMDWGVDWTMSVPETLPEGTTADVDEFFYSTSDRYNNTTHLIYGSQRVFIRPFHSEEYYKKAYNENYVLRFDYYLSCSTADTTRSVSVLNQGYQTKNVNTWYKGEISFTELIDNFNSLSCPVTNVTTETGALLNIAADTKNRVAIGIYVGNIRFEDSRISEDKTEYLIDVKDETEYDLTLHLPNDVKTAISEYSNTHAIKYYLSCDGNTTFVENGVLDLTDKSFLRKFNLTIKADTVVLYTGVLDLYDSSLPYAWNEITSSGLIVKSATYSTEQCVLSGNKDYQIVSASDATEGPLYGKTGNYVKISVNTAENVLLSLFPQHFEKYYDQLSGKGYVLTYDYYITRATVARYVGYADYQNAFKTWRGQLSDSKWGTISLSFDNYLLLDDAEITGCWFDFANQGNSGSAPYRLTVFELPASTDVYIGNFRIEQMPEYIAYNTASTSVDVAGSPSFDLLDCLTAEQKIKYESFVNKYRTLITWKLGFSDGTYTTLTAGQTVIGIDNYKSKLSNGKTNLSATMTATGPDGVSRIYTVITLSNKQFTNFASDVVAKLSATTSNYEILQNVNHYSTGELVEGTGIEITAVKNETESAQIIITPETDVRYYNIELLDLKDGANYLYSSNFTVFHQYYVEIKKSTGSYYPYSSGMYPDALIPMENAVLSKINHIASDDNQGIWIQFSIPKNQPAGTYNGVFNVYLENSFYTVPVTVNVVDYTLSDERHLLTKFGLSADNVKALEDVSDMSDEEFKVFADEYYYEALLDYGINVGSLFTYNTERWASTYWVGRPYDPDAILSFETVYVDGGYHYAYEYPLVSLGENDEFVVWTSHYKNGYGVNMNRVNDWISQALKYANDDRVNMYQLPVISGASVQFTAESLAILYPDTGTGYGNYTEARRDLETGFRMNSVNLLTTRDVYEQIFLASVENEVDLFKKGSFFCSWFDEYSNNASKLKVAKYITAIMKDYFPDLAEWIKTKHSVTDEFALSVLDSLSKIQLVATGENTYDFDPETQWMAHCPGDGQFSSEKRRNEILEWASSVYDGEGIVWTYNGGYKIEDPASVIKTRTWWMYDYDVEADLQWAIMSHQYLDGISDELVGKDVSDGDIIDSKDFYDIAVHYGGVSGIGFMIYPGSPFGVKGFVPSIRLDSYRDSTEDYDLLYALENYYVVRAKDKGVQYNSEDFDGIMDRLSERLYKGSKYKTQDGFQNDYAVSRNSLISMLSLAKNYGIIIEKHTLGTEIIFTVSAPESVSLEGYLTKTTANGYTDYTYRAGDEYFEFTYCGLTVKLSVSHYNDNYVIDELEWTDGENDEYKTYSETVVNSTSHPVTVEKVMLNAAVSVGGVSEGEYYKVSPQNESDWGMHTGFTLLPDHDKSYYETNASITSLKFDVYVELTDENGKHPDMYRLYYWLGHSQNSQQLTNEWFTVEIEMATIIEHWDALVGIQNDTQYRVTNGNLFTLYGAYGNTAVDITYYIGNFRIEHN